MFLGAIETENKIETAYNSEMAFIHRFLSFIKGSPLISMHYFIVRGWESIVNAGKILAAIIDRLCHSLLVSWNLESEDVLPYADCLQQK